LRVAAIAGPSSSGKTTFIKRLEIQLEVNGILPIRLSLDDYYVDRERSPRDEQGDYDFEAVEAIDTALFDDHARRLLAGERVKTPRYDFKAGRSIESGGPEVALGPSNLLLVEGLHALSPRILGSCGSREQSFRVFVHPATGLPFDRLTSVLAEDVRLVRRIVRDRHQRGYAASESIARWPSVRRGEERHVFTCMAQADAVFDSSLVYELAVLRVYAERYLLEIPENDPTYVTGYRLRQLIDRFVPIHADRVPATSILREFIGGSDFAI
jgi:uridine kinase